MALGEFLVIVGIGLFAKHIFNQNEAEYRRKQEEIEERRSRPCTFDDLLSQDDFIYIAHKAGKNIKRLIAMNVDGTDVHGVMVSQSGASDWNFRLDFNDYGRVTGKFWCESDNNDSNIPSIIGEKMATDIKKALRGEPIYQDKPRRYTYYKTDREYYDDRFEYTERIKKCTNCGKPVYSDRAKFCTYCGKPL